MSSAAFRAWRFDIPSPDETLARGGLSVDARGAPAVVSGHASIRQALRLLLMTSRGERVGRPDYGCDLEQLVFSPADDTTAGLAIHMVRQAVERWEPRVRILSLDAETLPSRPAVLEIQLEYEIRETAERESLALWLDLRGES